MDKALHPLGPPLHAEDIEVAVAEGNFHAGDHQDLPLVAEFNEGADRVVIGYDDEIQPLSPCHFDQFVGRMLPIRIVGVSMEVTTIPARLCIEHLRK